MVGRLGHQFLSSNGAGLKKALGFELFHFPLFSRHFRFTAMKQEMINRQEDRWTA
jgi:hypothetical protein